MDISTLKSEGYVKFAYPGDLRTTVTEAMDSWRAFCAMEETKKLQLGNPDRNNDRGYNLRRNEGDRGDEKEFAHVTGAWVSELHKAALEITDERAAAFITATARLIKDSTPMVERFASEVELEFQVPGFADEVMRNKDHWVFRFLHYFPGSNMLAHAHPDRGGFTLHLAETEPGGEYLPQGGKWQPWPVTEHETIIFPSMVLQHRTQCALKALWHRVAATEVTAKDGRYAMVAFIDFDYPYRYSDQSGRLAEKPEGFNWSMQFDEFGQLFEKRK